MDIAHSASGGARYAVIAASSVYDEAHSTDSGFAPDVIYRDEPQSAAAH